MVLAFVAVIFNPLVSVAFPLLENSQDQIRELSTDQSQRRLERLKVNGGYHHLSLSVFRKDVIKFKSVEQIAADFNTLEVRMTGGESYRALFSKGFVQPNGQVSWSGRIEGDLHSIAVFTEHDGHLAGEIHAFGKVLSIKPVERGLVAIRELDRSQVSSQGDDQVLVQSKAAGIATMATAVEDDGTVIDLYVFYNDAALAASASIVTEITNDIAFTNTALDSSCALTSIRLVGTQLITFSETGTIGTDLNAFADAYDGKADSVYTTMVNAGADMGQLWIEEVSAAPSGSGASTACGAAQTGIPYPVNTGFSIKVRSCSAYATAHEIGHNFTVLHDRYQCFSTKLNQNYPQESGWGYVNLNEKVRDIMSYDSECTAHGLSCTEVPYFSNPRIFINGQPFGLPAQADAVRQINRNRFYLARTRAAVTTPTAPTFSLCQEVRANELKLDKCFIATAAFGSFLDPHVIRFRQFRDHTMAKSEMGRRLIELYYQYSPGWVKSLEAHPALLPITRVVLWGLLFIAENIVFTLILISIGFAAFFARFVFRRIGRGSTAWLWAFALLAISKPPVSEAAVVNPTLFWGRLDTNPAALEVGRAAGGLSLNQFSTTNATKSERRDVVASKATGSSSAEVRWLGPRFSISAVASLPSKESFSRTMNEGTVDTWETRSESYGVQGAVGYGGGGSRPGLVLGASFRNMKVVLPRDGITDQYGTKATERSDQLSAGTLGVRWQFTQLVTIGAFLDYGRSVSSEMAAVNQVKTGLGVGYAGERSNFLRKIDLAYISSPPSLGYEESPYSTAWSFGKKGFNFDLEVGVEISTEIKTVALGFEYEALTWQGYKGEGSGAKETLLTIKAVIGFLDDKFLASANIIQRSVQYASLKETNSGVLIGASILF